MFIGILLGSAEINGGTYVIYEHGSRLKARGHRVAMITREQVNPAQYSWHPAASELEWFIVEEAEKLAFDIVVATWWQSAFLLHQFSAMHAVYFVQSIESRFFAPQDPADHDTRDNEIWKQLCESTYAYAIPMITEAGWIKEYLYERFNAHARLVPNGIRKDIYNTEGSAEAPRQDRRLRVLVEGPVDVFYKNVPKSIALCRRAGVDDVWLMTSSEISAYPGADRVFSRVPIERTAEIYRSCDLLIKLSHVEGMFGPPLEMFHCGGTAIVYDVTGHDEYIRDRENSYVVKKDDEEKVVALLKRLRSDHDELERLKAGAQKTAIGWPDWETSTSQFEGALEEIRTTAMPTSRHYLRRYSRQLWEDNQNRLNAKEVDFFSKREALNQGGNTDDFVQLYWHVGEGFNQHNFKWAHFVGGQWTTILLHAEAFDAPFYIRIDPSVRMGITIIERIEISNEATGRKLMTFRSKKELKSIEVSGTACRLQTAKNLTLFSYGNDPQLLLPPLEAISAGTDLVISINMKGIGFRHFTEQRCLIRFANPFYLWRHVVKKL